VIRFGPVEALLVVNSFASSVTARNTVMVHRALSAHHQVMLVETNRRGHATRFAQDAARRGVDAVIGFGGDGTLNEVATGIAGTSTALGVIPGGSTNVFARTIGLPNDPVAAAPLVAAGLAAGNLRRIGLGRVNGRYFCFHIGIGFDAAVVRAVERRAAMKRWFGHPLFIGAALSAWAHYDSPPFTLEATAPTSARTPSHPLDPITGRFCVVLNTNPYTFLGNRPLNLAPDATLERRLVALTFTDLRAPGVLRALVEALHSEVRERPYLKRWADLDRLSMTAERPVPYQVDGDYLGETTRLEIEHVADAVDLIVPSAAEQPLTGLSATSPGRR
jgi:diacylglycerol kinase family enzyme